MVTRALLILACVVCAIGLIVSTSGARPAAQAEERGELIPQPDTWVPFSAEITRTLPTGESVTGQVYRGADGNELTIETVSDGNTTVVIRHITNYTHGLYYHSAKPKEWFSGPLRMPASGRRQVQFRTKSPGLQRYNWKLAMRNGEQQSLNADAGFDAWLSTASNGTTHLLVPALNFYPVVSSSVGGARRVLSQIVIGPVDASMFVPPPGESIRSVDEPMPPAHVGGAR